MSVAAADREAAVERDRSDPLRAFRDRFVFADDGVIYLDGNSLGRLPADTPARVDDVIRGAWGSRLIRAWSDGWLELPQRIGDRLGHSLLGAAGGQVAVADSTTVCFYKLASAALSARPGRTEIITDRDNFPTDRYVLEALAAQRDLTIRWLEADPATGPEPDQVAELLGPQTALVALSHIAYRSAFVLDLPEITRLVRDAGALTLWDLCHSAGVFPIELDASGVDLAVGCTYKYLNGGPGAPAFLYMRAEHQGRLRQPIWGWLGTREPFEMVQGYEPADGIVSMLSGTPPVLALAAVSVGADLVIEAGVGAIREKSIALTEFAIALADEWLGPLGVSIGSPRDGHRRGAHVALVHPRARQLCASLIGDGVIVDFRAPDAIRLGLSPLTTSFADVWDGLHHLRQSLESGL
jgi:kynureninase